MPGSVYHNSTTWPRSLHARYERIVRVGVDAV